MLFEVEDEVGVANGSEFRNECEADWRLAFVFVTSEVRFECRREDLRGGRGVFVVVEARERFVVDAAYRWLFDVVVDGEIE